MDPKFVDESFAAADRDSDGSISGPEAVAFFSRSGLPTNVLRQVWELASGNSPKLHKPQFINALRLVSLAQSLGGQLDLPKARITLAGMGPSLPPPDVTGTWRPGPPNPLPTPAGAPPHMTGSGSGGLYASAMGFRPQAPVGYAPQQTGGGGPSYAPQFTGAGYVPQATGVGGLPPAQPADMQRYEAAFLQLDTDKDGLVKGGDCFGYFMKWGLDKAVLKHVWDLVAGNKGTLNKQQMAGCLYLMDNAKKGIKPPQKLPPGPFPPVATSWTPQSQFTQAKLGAAPPYQPPPLPVMPQLPIKYVEPATTSPPPEKPSTAPKLDEPTAAMLTEAEKTKITLGQREAAEKEANLHSAETQAATSKARLAAYNAALQEITVFKSRTDIALLQGQDEAARLEEELVTCKRKYEQSYSHAQSQGRAATKLHERLAEIIEQRTEGEKKLVALQAEIAAASKLTPEDVARMEAHVAMLAQQVSAAEQAHDAASLRLSSIREHRTALEAKLKEAQEAAAAAAKDEEAARTEVMALANEAQAARGNKGGKGSVGKTAELLSKAAAAYRTLYTSVGRAGGEVPFDALPSNLGLATWLDDALAGAADFADNMGAIEASHGYVLVNALPGQVMPKPPGEPAAEGQKQPSSHDSAAPQDQQLASTDAAPPKAPPSTQPPPAAESEEQQQQSSTQPLAAAESQEQQQQRQPSGPPPLPAEGFSDGFGDDAFVMVGAQDVGGAQAGSAQGKPESQAPPFPHTDPFGGGAALFGVGTEEAPPPSASSQSDHEQVSEQENTQFHLPPPPSSFLPGMGSYGLHSEEEEHDEQAAYTNKRGGKKKVGGGLDGLFADDGPFVPPPPPAQPAFPAFSPPAVGGDSSSDEEGDHSSSDDMPDTSAGHPWHPSAQNLAFQVGGQDDSSDPEEAEEQEEQEQGAQGGHCTTEEPARAESATAPHQILSSPSDTGVPSGAGHPAPAPAEPQAQAGASSSTDFTAIPGASDSGIDAAGPATTSPPAPGGDMGTPRSHQNPTFSFDFDAPPPAPVAQAMGTPPPASTAIGAPEAQVSPATAIASSPPAAAAAAQNRLNPMFSESGDLRSEASADKDAHPPTLAGQQEGASESTQVAAALANAGQGGQAHASDKDDPLL